MKDKIVDMKFTLYNADGTVNEEKAAALMQFGQVWGALLKLGASEDELEVLLRMWSQMARDSLAHVPSRLQVRGQIEKQQLLKTFVEAMAMLLDQFAAMGLSEDDAKQEAEKAITRVFGRNVVRGHFGDRT